MSIVSAKEAKNRFGDLLLSAQRGPVVIEKNGKPVAVVTSVADHEAAEAAKLAALRRDLAIADEDLSAGRYAAFDDDRAAAIKARGRERLARKV